MSVPDLTCRELVEIITEYVEGALALRERQVFEAHLAECDGCSEYLDQMGTTIEAVGRLSEESISAVARDALLDGFRDWKRA